MKKKVRLNIKNSILRNFLSKLDFFEYNFDENSENDFLFTDVLDCGEYLRAKAKVYFHTYETIGLNHFANFQNFQYFINFGNSYLESVFTIQPSVGFENFIFDEQYENTFPNKDFDIFIYSACDIPNIVEHKMIIDFCEMIDISNLDLRIGTNAKNFDIYQPVESKTYNKINRVDFEIPFKYLLNSTIIYSLSEVNTMNNLNELDHKVWTPGILQSSLYCIARETQLKETNLNSPWARLSDKYSCVNILNSFKENKKLNRYYRTNHRNYIVIKPKIYDDKNLIPKAFYNFKQEFEVGKIKNTQIIHSFCNKYLRNYLKKMSILNGEKTNDE